LDAGGALKAILRKSTIACRTCVARAKLGNGGLLESWIIAVTPAPARRTRTTGNMGVRTGDRVT
jgi:hypothetical protein